MSTIIQTDLEMRLTEVLAAHATMDMLWGDGLRWHCTCRAQGTAHAVASQDELAQMRPEVLAEARRHVAQELRRVVASAEAGS